MQTWRSHCPYRIIGNPGAANHVFLMPRMGCRQTRSWDHDAALPRASEIVIKLQRVRRMEFGIIIDVVTCDHPEPFGELPLEAGRQRTIGAPAALPQLPLTKVPVVPPPASRRWSNDWTVRTRVPMTSRPHRPCAGGAMIDIATSSHRPTGVKPVVAIGFVAVIARQ